MSAPEPRLLAVDLDGTLLDPAGTLPERTRHALRAVRDAGVTVVLATGRSPWSTAPIAAQLGLPGPHILMQGGLIASLLGEQSVWAATLDPALVGEHLAFARTWQLQPILGYEHGYRAESLEPAVADLPWPLYAEGSRLEIVPALETAAGTGVIRTFLFTSPARHAEIRQAAAARFGNRSSLTWGDEHGVELLAPGVTKGAALRRLAEREGVSMEQVAAIGDGRNDLEMLAAAGRSAAVASAPPEVRAVAQLVVPSNGGEGALAALHTWFPWLNEAVAPPQLSIA